MKKLLAFLLMAVMLFSLVACGNNEDNPSGSNTNNPGISQGGDNQGGNSDDGDESGNNSTENGDAQNGLAWPTADYITSAMKFEGSGKISDSKLQTYSVDGQNLEGYSVFIEEATLDEVGAYIEALKADGFVYVETNGQKDEPALVFVPNSFDEGFFAWSGETSDKKAVGIKLYEVAKTGSKVDNGEYSTYKYKLQIDLREGI